MKLLYFAILTACNAFIVLGNQLARGFNDDIHWVSMKDGLEAAQKEKKPALVLIHKSWCGACKALKPKFVTDMDIEKLSKEFVMINIMDDEEPKERQFAPDGGYIPRIVFMNSEGVVHEDIKNEDGNPQYQYFYSEPQSIYKSMQKAMKLHKSSSAEEL